MKRFIYNNVISCLLVLCFLINNSKAQFSLTVANYTQDFNDLGTGSSTVLGGNLGLIDAGLNGWYFNETGTNSNTTIISGTGSSNTGDTYNFGTSLDPDRTLGGLLSNNLEPVYGFYLTNNTGSTITGFQFSYTGEQWRLGATGRIDQLDFQYSANATNLSNGDWSDADALDFIAPVTSGTVGALDGNQAANRTTIGPISITNIYIPNGATFFIRFTDYNSTGADDGLGIDDFSLLALTTSYSTAYFRSTQTGNWNNTSTWESSSDFVTWVPATGIPTADADTILIRNGHSVSYLAFLPVDEVVIQNGGVLNLTGGTFTLRDGASNDIEIESGGVMELSSSGNPPVFENSPIININSAGTLRVSAGGMTGAGSGVNANNYVYQHQSVLEISVQFSSSGVTFFPNVNAATIPIFRTINTGAINVGGINITIINGVYEANGAGLTTWQNTANKVFRNGVRGTGNITANASAASAKFIINGASAELGGTGSLTVPTTGGLEIGANCYVTMISDKSVSGNVHLISNSFIELATNTLTVTGSVTGGASTSHIITNSTGLLKITNAGAGPVNFPVGHSSTSYNPVTIDNSGTTIDFSIRVEQGINPGIAFPTYGVDRTWTINTSANPDGTVVTTFQYEAAHCQAGVLPQPQTMEVLKNVSNVWNIIAPNINPTGSDPYVVSTNLITSFNAPFAVGKNGGWVLPVELINFTTVLVNSNSAEIKWELAACCSKNVKFEIQRSLDKINFKTIADVLGNEANRFYSVTDNSLPRGFLYYRLKITDYAGKIIFSPVIVLNNKIERDFNSTVFPNISNGSAILKIFSFSRDFVYYTIQSINGQMFEQNQILTFPGTNLFSLNLGKIPAGAYIIKLVNKTGKKEIIKFLKQ